MPAPPRDTPLRAAAPWVVLVGALMAWQLAAYVQHPRSDHHYVTEQQPSR